MVEQMTAYGFMEPKHDQELPPIEKQTVDVPSPEGREILVEVKAVSVNPTDLATWSQKKESDNSFTVLGRDVSGTVVETGPDAELFKKGDQVFYPGTPSVQGAEADYHKVDERMAALKPDNLSFAEAAALPLTALTAYETFHDRLQLFNFDKEPKDTKLLIVGAAGGVGSIASQIALSYGFNVIGTASREESRSYLRELGISTIINHHEPFEEQLKDQGFEMVDAVFLAVKPDKNIEEAAKVIKPQGRICSLLPLEEPLPSKFFSKSVTFSYELMYTRSIYQTDDWIKQHDYLTELKEQVEKGAIKTTKTKHFSEMNEETLTEAYKQLKDEHTVGKIVLEHSN